MKHLTRLFTFTLTLTFLSLLSGCMNLYTRCPGTKPTIESIYQCSREMIPLSYVVMFPQVMSPGSADDFYWENLITVPCGLICFGDTACEAVVDTVCLPFDYPISRYRRRSNP